MRIVSLIASSTEIICALGFKDSIVGRSHECDFPLDIKSLPVCTSPKFQVDGTSYEIDQRVKAILQEALSVYRVSAESLVALKPDIIVTQTQCEVCAVSFRDVEEALRECTGLQPKIVPLNTNCLEDLWADIRRVAAALDANDKAETLVTELKGRMQAIKDKVEDKAKTAVNRPSVACIEWIEPLMSAGNWMPELVEMAGGKNLFGEAGKHSPWMTWEGLVEKDPDYIFVLPCGFDIPRTLTEMPLLTERPEWRGLKAVKDERVFVLDGNQYFNRPGPRLVESLEIIAEILHPEIFEFGYEDNGWVRVNQPKMPLE